VIANLPDGRVIAIDRDKGEIVWDKQVAGKTEFGRTEKFLTAPWSPTARSSSRTARATAERADGLLRSKSGRARNVALVRRAQARRPGQRNLERRPQRMENGGGGIWQTGSYDPATKLYIVGTGNPFPIYDPQARPGDNLYTDSAVALNIDTGKPAWHFQYTPNDSWDYDEVGVHMLYDATVNGEQRKIVGHFGRNGFYYTLDRTNGKFIKADQYVNDLNWTKGINPKTGRPLDYDPKLDVQIYNPVARALRGDGKKRACPTWHGGVAHQPTAYHPVKKIAYGVGIEGCFTQNGAAVVFKSKDGDVDVKASEKREYSSDLYYGSVTAFDTTSHKVIAKAITDIEIRSGAIVTAGGLVFTALQDGWVIAYHDETLEELWRFNLGTPLKARR